jgi:hypothetical protein
VCVVFITIDVIQQVDGMCDGNVADPFVDSITTTVTGAPTTLTITTTTAAATKSESSDVNETNILRVADCDSTGTVHKNAVDGVSI